MFIIGPEQTNYVVIDMVFLQHMGLREQIMFSPTQPKKKETTCWLYDEEGAVEIHLNSSRNISFFFAVCSSSYWLMVSWIVRVVCVAPTATYTHTTKNAYTFATRTTRLSLTQALPATNTQTPSGPFLTKRWWSRCCMLALCMAYTYDLSVVPPIVALQFIFLWTSVTASNN